MHSKLYSLEAEQSTLAGALIEDGKIPELIDVDESQFYIPETRLVHRAICELYRTGLYVDQFSVADYLIRQDQLPGADWAGALQNWIDSMTGLELFDSYLKVLGEYAQRRDLERLANDLLIQIDNGDVGEIVEGLQERVVCMITKTQSTGFTSFTNVLTEAINEVQRRYDGDGSPDGQVTGYNALDNAIDGFQNGRVYVIAGRTSMGKSAFALQLLWNLAKTDQWLMFSLEMTNKSIGMRAISNMANLFGGKLKGRPKLEQHEFGAIGGGFASWKDKPILIDQTPGLSIAQIRARCKVQQVRHGKVGGIIVDHIGLVRASKNTRGPTEAMTETAHALQELAKEFDCPLIELVQINRGSEGQRDNRPSMHQLKQSGAIEEDADVVMLLYRDEYYNADTQHPNITEVNIAKNRDGETKMIAFSHNLATGRYREIGEQEVEDYKPTKTSGVDL